MRIKRNKTRRILLGNIPIGRGAPVSIQSMTNTRTADAEATIAQIRRLEEAGCDIVRIAVPNETSAKAVKIIRAKIRIPLVADIHFDHRLALLAMENGCDGLRLNPGNIRDPEKVKAVVRMARARHIPIRIGVNRGSVDRKRYPPSAEGLVASALEHVRLLERCGFRDIKVSLKASDIPETIEANRLFSRKRNYPLHIGITESGTAFTGAIRSAVGCGILLAEGIGDTIRVSLSTDPVREVLAARHILRSLGLRTGGVEVVSCPTCGRTTLPVERIAMDIEEKTAGIRSALKVAVMGCFVNGPGEARDADIGLAGVRHDEAVLFKKGESIGSIRGNAEDMIEKLMEEIGKMTGEKRLPE